VFETSPGRSVWPLTLNGDPEACQAWQRKGAAAAIRHGTPFLVKLVLCKSRYSAVVVLRPLLAGFASAANGESGIHAKTSMACSMTSYGVMAFVAGFAAKWIGSCWWDITVDQA